MCPLVAAVQTRHATPCHARRRLCLQEVTKTKTDCVIECPTVEPRAASTVNVTGARRLMGKGKSAYTTTVKAMTPKVAVPAYPPKPIHVPARPQCEQVRPRAAQIQHVGVVGAGYSACRCACQSVRVRACVRGRITSHAQGNRHGSTKLEGLPCQNHRWIACWLVCKQAQALMVLLAGGGAGPPPLSVFVGWAARRGGGQTPKAVVNPCGWVLGPVECRARRAWMGR
jgi:hypothetical protein